MQVGKDFHEELSCKSQYCNTSRLQACYTCWRKTQGSSVEIQFGDPVHFPNKHSNSVAVEVFFFASRKAVASSRYEAVWWVRSLALHSTQNILIGIAQSWGWDDKSIDSVTSCVPERLCSFIVLTGYHALRHCKHFDEQLLFICGSGARSTKEICPLFIVYRVLALAHKDE